MSKRCSLTGWYLLLSRKGNTKNVLQGKRSEKEILLDKNGNMEKLKGPKEKTSSFRLIWISKKGVEDILSACLYSRVSWNATPKVLHAVTWNPILGKVPRDKNTVGLVVKTVSRLGTVTNVFVPGSVVKGATLTSGWENGAISGNQILTTS